VRYQLLVQTYAKSTSFLLDRDVEFIVMYACFGADVSMVICPMINDGEFEYKHISQLDDEVVWEPKPFQNKKFKLGDKCQVISSEWGRIKNVQNSEQTSIEIEDTELSENKNSIAKLGEIVRKYTIRLYDGHFPDIRLTLRITGFRNRISARS